MRNLIYAINLTIDGCCDHDKMVADEGIYDYHTRLLQDADVLLYGRKTYQLMFPYWPDVAKNHSGDSEGEDEFAQAFVSVKETIVFSRTLDKVEGANTRIVRTNLEEEIVKLKQEQGKNILVGGVDIASQLIKLDLVDEYHFVVNPVMAGEGRHLLDGSSLPEKLQLNLVGSKVYKSGCIALHYTKK